MNSKLSCKIVITVVVWVLIAILAVGCVVSPTMPEVTEYPTEIPTTEPTTEPTPEYTLNLTLEQKVADFEVYYNTITTSVPYLDAQQELYGFNITTNHERYLNLIRETEDDFDFFCTMYAIGQESLSAHTGVRMPNYAELENPLMVNVDELYRDRRHEILLGLWEQLIIEKLETFPAFNAAGFEYVDGEYVYSNILSSRSFDALDGAIIEAVDGLDADEYIRQFLAINAIKYDHINRKVYRSLIRFNDSIGEPVTLTLRGASGEVTDIVLYASVQADFVAEYRFIAPYEIGALPENFYRYSDTENNVEYIKVNSFFAATDYAISVLYGESELDMVTEIFNSIADDAYIIIDLRGNGGGTIDYAAIYLYRQLYSGTIRSYREYYVPKTDANSVYNTPEYKRVNMVSETDGGVKYNADLLMSGGARDFSGRVFYLVNGYSMSTADSFAALVREFGLGTVIGGNTGGEGLGMSFCNLGLPNSGLIYSYFPASAENADGTDNSVYGTAPDIYAAMTIPQYEIMVQQLKNGVTIGGLMEYENCIKYDAALIRALEEIRRAG